MATFVLVHGAWHGGWCWKKVAPLLRRAGAEVYTPTLTGMGERAHLTGYLEPAAINLDLHQRDVVQLLEFEDLAEVVLVGHAYAGMIITGVAEVCPERLKHLVYVNGVVPKDGESMVDQLEAVRGPQFTAWVRGHLGGKGGFLPPPASPEEVGRRWGITDADDLAWVGAKVTPQPAAAFAQPVRLGRPEAQSIPRSFVGSSEAGFDSVAERVKAAGWGIYHIDSGHDPMVTNPEDLAEILLRIASGGERSGRSLHRENRGAR